MSLALLAIVSLGLIEAVSFVSVLMVVKESLKKRYVSAINVLCLSFGIFIGVSNLWIILIDVLATEYHARSIRANDQEFITVQNTWKSLYEIVNFLSLLLSLVILPLVMLFQQEREEYSIAFFGRYFEVPVKKIIILYVAFVATATIILLSLVPPDQATFVVCSIILVTLLSVTVPIGLLHIPMLCLPERQKNSVYLSSGRELYQPTLDDIQNELRITRDKINMINQKNGASVSPTQISRTDQKLLEELQTDEHVLIEKAKDIAAYEAEAGQRFIPFYLTDLFRLLVALVFLCFSFGLFISLTGYSWLDMVCSYAQESIYHLIFFFIFLFLLVSAWNGVWVLMKSFITVKISRKRKASLNSFGLSTALFLLATIPLSLVLLRLVVPSYMTYGTQRNCILRIPSSADDGILVANNETHTMDQEFMVLKVNSLYGNFPASNSSMITCSTTAISQFYSKHMSKQEETVLEIFKYSVVGNFITYLLLLLYRKLYADYQTAADEDLFEYDSDEETFVVQTNWHKGRKYSAVPANENVIRSEASISDIPVKEEEHNRIVKAWKRLSGDAPSSKLQTPTRSAHNALKDEPGRRRSSMWYQRLLRPNTPDILVTEEISEGE
ncbi:hypothetical protein MP638_001008 [Amoeboaphelidium occidentale]|nr:hypothetical protein MP638_001008 [Amoeboaphelidium occidentale]